MPSSSVLEGRAILQESKAKLFDLVCNNASEEQWAEWLRVPLEHAMAAGDLALRNDLLAAGASWKAGWRGCHDRTLLCAAVQGGKVEVVEDLLNSGAKIEVNVRESEEGRVPLHYAVDNGHEAIVEQLLLSGASPNRQDSTGVLPIHTAVSRGYGEIVSLLLLRRAATNFRNDEGDSPLHVAARKGHASVARALLIAGADSGLRSDGELSALDLAAADGHVDVIRALVQHGADVASCCSNGFTPLHEAAYYDQADAVDVLVKLGCSVRVRCNKWSTPLHMAAKYGNCSALVALLRHNAYVHAMDDQGRSPLMEACMNVYPKAADLLLRWGADETIADDEGLSAVQLIGTGLEEEEREECQQEMDSMRKVLANAPADRAWRRRGWLVLCRAFPQKTRLGLDRNQDDRDSMGGGKDAGSSTRAVVRRRTQQMDASTGTGNDGEGTDSTTAASFGSTKSNRRAGSCNIETRVVEMEQANLFRIIVSFL